MQITTTQHIDIKFKIKETSYGVTAKGEVYNLKTMRKLRRVVIGVTKGYCLNGKLTSLIKIKPLLEKLNEYCPF